MTRETDRSEIDALRRALDTACDEIQRQRDIATQQTVRAERAIAHRIPRRQQPDAVTHALAFAAGSLTCSLVIFVLHFF